MSMQDPQKVRRMFGGIVRRYDLANSLMSLGMDRAWRKAAAAAAHPQGAVALDVGTGTGALARELLRQGASRVIGGDFTEGMVRAARSRGPGDGPAWLLADALHLPFAGGSFDCVTNAFVLRNLRDLREGLEEMTRVLRPGGRLVCLDMTRPPRGAFGAVYRLYFSRLVPPLMGFLSGSPGAYRYLPQSVFNFHSPDSLAALLADAGLTQVSFRLLARGTVALHRGVKPA